MIKRDAKLALRRVRLEKIRVFEHQQRYPERLRHYVALLAENDSDDLGVLIMKPRKHGFELLDGHHRFVALVMSGREDALCLIVDERN